MANFYLRSAATGTGTGASWANAFTTMAAAAAAIAAGDDLWVSEDHNESQSLSINISFPGTAASPNRIVCVNHAGSVPPVAADITTGAQVTTTGNSGITIATAGNGGLFWMYGVRFNSGNSTGGSSIVLNNAHCYYDTCTFSIVGTSAASKIQLSGVGGKAKNCTWLFANASQSFSTSSALGNFTIEGGAVAPTGTVPTVLISANTVSNARVTFDGVDLSTLGSGKSLLTSTSAQQNVKFVNCKLGASISALTGTALSDIGQDAGVDILGSNNAGVVARNERYRAQGTLTTETTIIRAAGASDGATAFSWKIASSSLTAQAWPFDTFEGVRWNALTGAPRTLTFHCVTDNVALNSNDIWVEVEYLGDAGDPMGSFISSGPATILSGGAALTADAGEAWTTTGLTTPNKQKFSVTFTPQIAGLVRWRVKVAKASTTIYLDPNPDLS